MKPLRLTVSVLGRSLLDVRLGDEPDASPTPPETVEAADGNDPGAVTERRTTAVIGFSSAVHLPAERRRPVVR